MNNTEIKQKQFFQSVEQEQLVGYWISRYGISKKDLDTHPQIDDLMLLIRWKAEFYKTGTAKHKKFFDNTWNWVYNNKLPLKAKQLRTLAYYTEGNIRHRQNLLNTQAEKRQKIQALRQAH